VKRRGLPVGLLGRLLVILLATVGVEFGVSTWLYERSSHVLIQDDEAHRLAEHLVITRKLVAERSWAERPAMAERLSTNRYDIHWTGSAELPPAVASDLDGMRDKVIDWEPSLADSDMRLRVVASGRDPLLFGAFRLPDQTWIRFRAATPAQADARVFRRILVALAPAALLLLVGALLFRHTLRPMGMLARGADRGGRGGSITLPETGPREVRRVIRAFNTMQARIHRLIADRTQALAAVGHDLRTPLSRMQLRTDLIDDPALRSAFSGDVAEMEAMVESLLAYLGGESNPEAPVRTDVAVMAATVVDDASDRGGDVTYVGDDHLEAMVRPIGLKRAIANLVENGVHYGGIVRVAVTGQAGTILIRVDDDGPGIPIDQIDEVLQPFSRLDTARGRNTTGLGLGLAIVAAAAAQEGGTLRLANREDGGLRAELTLPRR
jgi:signal transduction histidine kinase